jgi:hypothetical protein
MSNGKNYIPRSIKLFNLYLARICAYLVLGAPTNATRFNWTAANLAAMQNFLSLWIPLYTQYTNKKGGYMPVIRTKLLAIISNTVAYAQTNKLIELVMATVSLNADDCVAFGLPEKLIITPTGPQPLQKTKELDKTIVTKEPVYPKLIPIAGGFLHTKAYTEKTQSGRAHKLKGFDLLEYAVAVFYSTATGLPVTASDPRLLIGHSSKASFIMEVTNMSSNLTAIAAGNATPTKIAVLFFRWAKSKHPDLDGPWSGPFTTPLL